MTLHWQCSSCGQTGTAPNSSVASIWSLEGCNECMDKVDRTSKRLIESTMLILLLDSDILETASESLTDIIYLQKMGHLVGVVSRGDKSIVSISDWAPNLVCDRGDLISPTSLHPEARSLLVSNDVVLSLLGQKCGYEVLSWATFKDATIKPYLASREQYV